MSAPRRGHDLFVTVDEPETNPGAGYDLAALALLLLFVLIAGGVAVWLGLTGREGLGMASLVVAGVHFLLGVFTSGAAEEARAARRAAHERSRRGHRS